MNEVTLRLHVTLLVHFRRRLGEVRGPALCMVCCGQDHAIILVRIELKRALIAFYDERIQVAAHQSFLVRDVTAPTDVDHACHRAAKLQDHQGHIFAMHERADPAHARIDPLHIAKQITHHIDEVNAPFVHNQFRHLSGIGLPCEQLRRCTARDGQHAVVVHGKARVARGADLARVQARFELAIPAPPAPVFIDYKANLRRLAGLDHLSDLVERSRNGFLA